MISSLFSARPLMAGRPTFWQGVMVAVVLSLGGAVAHVGLGSVVGAAVGSQLLITGLSGGYIAWLLSRSRGRSGKISGAVIWWLAALAIWGFAPSQELFLFAHLGLIWLCRSVLSYRSVFAAGLDLLLHAVALSAAAWAAIQTNSLLITLWCFFLVQAFYALIPTSFKTPSVGATRAEDDFERAHRNAQGALQRLSQQAN